MHVVSLLREKQTAMYIQSPTTRPSTLMHVGPIGLMSVLLFLQNFVL